MRTRPTRILLSSLAFWISASAACHGNQDDEPPSNLGTGASTASAPAPRRLIEQVTPPLDIKTLPGDTTKTASGLRYKKLVANEAGAQPTRHGTALIHYTGWRQRTGDTFFTTTGRDQPIAIDLSQGAPGFTEALQLLHKGEKAVLWVPPGEGIAEPVVYEVEVVDVVSLPSAQRR